MKIMISLRSELRKTRGTSLWLLCVIASVAVPVLSFFSASSPYKIAELKPDPWNNYLMGTAGGIFSMMIIPAFLLLLCTIYAQLEYRNNTWKQVYVSPQSLLTVYFSKFLLVQLLTIGIIILNGILMLASLFGVHYFQNDIGLFQDKLDWKQYSIFTGRAYITVLAITAIQFWLGLRFRAFIGPILIGVCLLFAAMIMIEEQPWRHDNKFPYMYPMRNIYPRSLSDRSAVIWGSIVYAILFFIVGFLDFKRRRSK